MAGSVLIRTWVYDPLDCPSVRARAFEARMTVVDWLAREACEARARVEAHAADVAAQRAWMAQRDAYAAAGDWLMVGEMDNA